MPLPVYFLVCFLLTFLDYFCTDLQIDHREEIVLLTFQLRCLLPAYIVKRMVFIDLQISHWKEIGDQGEMMRKWKQTFCKIMLKIIIICTLQSNFAIHKTCGASKHVLQHVPPHCFSQFWEIRFINVQVFVNKSNMRFYTEKNTFLFVLQSVALPPKSKSVFTSL